MIATAILEDRQCCSGAPKMIYWLPTCNAEVIHPHHHPTDKSQTMSCQRTKFIFHFDFVPYCAFNLCIRGRLQNAPL
jgi:hypothetical protein